MLLSTIRTSLTFVSLIPRLPYPITAVQSRFYTLASPPRAYPTVLALPFPSPNTLARRTYPTMPSKRPLPDSVDTSAKRPKKLEKEHDGPEIASKSQQTAGSNQKQTAGKGDGEGDALEEDFFTGNICESALVCIHTS